MTGPTPAPARAAAVPPAAINFEAWARNAVTFIRERGLEREFQDWCGGWSFPIPAPALAAVRAYQQEGK